MVLVREMQFEVKWVTFDRFSKMPLPDANVPQGAENRCAIWHFMLGTHCFPKRVVRGQIEVGVLIRTSPDQEWFTFERFVGMHHYRVHVSRANASRVWHTMLGMDAFPKRINGLGEVEIHLCNTHEDMNGGRVPL